MKKAKEPKPIRSKDDLEKIKSTWLRQRDSARFRLLVCAGAGCISSG